MHDLVAFAKLAIFWCLLILKCTIVADCAHSQDTENVVIGKELCERLEAIIHHDSTTGKIRGISLVLGDVSDRDIEGILKNYSSIEEFTVYSRNATDKIIPHLANTKGLKTITLITPKLTDKVASLSQLSQLSCVHFESDSLTGETTKALASNKRISAISLSSKKIKDQDCIFFKDCRHIRDLHLKRCSITDEFSHTLSTMTGLEILWLQEVGSGEKTYNALKRLEFLKILTLQSVTFPSERIEFLRKCTSINWLNLHNVTVSNELIDEISMLPSLKYLSLEGSVLPINAIESINAKMPNVELSK